MKKTYVKPVLYKESFQLMEHIAGNCIVNDGFAGAHHRRIDDCAYTDGNLALFYDAGNGCDMSIYPDGVTPGEGALVELNVACYNNFLIVSHLFAS